MTLFGRGLRFVQSHVLPCVSAFVPSIVSFYVSFYVSPYVPSNVPHFVLPLFHFSSYYQS